MTEKKAFLKDAWESTKRDASIRRNLIPKQEKMDIVNWRLPGVGDSKICGIDIAPVDWQTCLALNARLDKPVMSGRGEHTIRESWAQPEPTLERRSIPGMAVAHIVVETLDERFLVCQRQLKGMRTKGARGPCQSRSAGLGRYTVYSIGAVARSKSPARVMRIPMTSLRGPYRKSSASLCAIRTCSSSRGTSSIQSCIRASLRLCGSLSAAGRSRGSINMCPTRTNSDS